MNNNAIQPFGAPLSRGVLLSCLGLALAAPALAQAAPPVAAQMYTLRDFGSLEEQFAAVERAGIEAVEIVGTHDVSAEELDRMLDAHGLEVVSSHVAIDDLRGDIEEVIAFNQAVGNDTLVIPYLVEEARPDDAESWQELGEEMGAMAERLEADGLRLAYHNHDFEMQAYDGRTALEILLESAGPKVLGEVDLAWVARGGLDPADYLSRFEGRLFAVHAKDNAPAGTAEDERGFAILGEGVLDWQAILPAAEAAGAEWYIIEHDQPRDAQAVVTEGNRFLSEALSALGEE